MKYIILIPSYKPDNKLIELLKNIDKNIDVVLVDDGSGSEYNSVNDEAKKYAHLIKYEENKGKGYAIKKGLKYIKDNYKEYTLVTVDSDGQHKYSDALKLLDYASKNSDTLVIGKRHWDKTTPIRSRIGNYITRKIFKRLTGLKIYDTQSGLRAFSSNLVDYMLKTKGERYEYEMNVLLGLKENNIKVKELKIETIYIDNNKGSHYKLISDSKKIYNSIKEYKSDQND